MLTVNQFPSPRIVALAFALFVAPTSPWPARRRCGGINASHPAPRRRPSESAKKTISRLPSHPGLQATADQRAAFVKIAQSLQEAADQLQAFRESLRKRLLLRLSERATAVNQASKRLAPATRNSCLVLSRARIRFERPHEETGKSRFRPRQTSQNFDQQPCRETGKRATCRRRRARENPGSFQAEHLSLGKEMSILLPTNGRTRLQPSRVIDTIKAAGQTISIPFQASFRILRPAFPRRARRKRPQPAELSLLRSRRPPAKHRRRPSLHCAHSPLRRALEVQQATLTPLVPASLVAANVHYERWVCPLAKTPWNVRRRCRDRDQAHSLGRSQSGLVLASELGRVAANGSLRDALRTATWASLSAIK